MTAADAAVCRCGHPRSEHAYVTPDGPCGARFDGCTAFVADVSRPDDAEALGKKYGVTPAAWEQPHHTFTGKPAAVPDREGATEQLAKTDLDRFNERWEADEDGCYIWTAHRTRDGYGMFWDRRIKRQVRAHRWIYEYALGPTPEGMFVLHSCDKPACVNPGHLRWGTHTENMADMTERGRHHETVKTHCKRGHEFTPENTITTSAGRRCRTCYRQAHKDRVECPECGADLLKTSLPRHMERRHSV